MAEMKVTNLGLLLRCYEGLRNWRALAMLAAGFVVAALLMTLDSMIGVRLGFEHPVLAMLLGGLIAILAALVLLAGINGSGLLLVDQADGQASRGFGAAFFGGLGVTLQAIVCLVILGLGLLLVILVLWALSFLARIPGIGGFFAFVLAGPTLLILAFCYAVLAFGVALMLVALWRGHGMLGSIGRAIDIVIKRPLDTVLHFIVLALLIVPIEFFVAAVMFGAAMLTGAMYASGSFGGAFGYGGGPAAMLMQSLSGGSMGAVAISIALVVAAVYALFVVIQMLGMVLIFDSLAAETSASSADFLRKKANEVKTRVDEHRPQAAQPPQQPPAAPPQPSRTRSTQPPTAPAAPSAAAHCSNCNAPLTPGDRFCGECGTAVS